MEVTAVQRTGVREEYTVLAELLTPILHSNLTGGKKTQKPSPREKESLELHTQLHINTNVKAYRKYNTSTYLHTGL